MPELAVTGFIFLVGLLVLAGIDVWLYRKPNSPTLSTLMAWIGARWPLFPPLVAFLMGVLFGHFFF